jgi:hypothetical protein
MFTLFGYLRERERGEDIPSECISCRMSVECMLTNQTSNDAVKERNGINNRV